MKISLRMLYVFIVTFMFCSCKYDHDMYFDIKTQQLKSCNSLIRNVKLSSNDEDISLFWEDTIQQAPKSLNLNNIPKGYKINTGGLLRQKPFKMKKNQKYIIEKWGSGVPSFIINIWTDSKGNVFKTTHPDCGLESLEDK